MKTVLIADDDADLVELLTRRCRALGLEVDSASNAMTALGKAEEMLPDVAILDLRMPYGNGLSVCEMMASHEQLRDTPVILLTGDADEATIRRCHQLCAYYVPKSTDLWSRVEPLLCDVLNLEIPMRVESPQATPSLPQAEPLESSELLDTVFALLGVEEDGSLLEDEAQSSEQRSDEPWVLSIEDDDDIALALKLRLKEHGLQVHRAAAGSEGYRRAFLEKPRAILLDYELPQGNGDYVLRRLKESPATRDIPVIVLTGRKEASIERQMRNLGAREFLTKPFDWTQLRSVLDDCLDEQRLMPS